METVLPNLVTEADRRAYDEDGVVLISQAIGPAELEELRDSVDAELSERARKQFSFGKDESTFRGSQDMWRTNATFAQVCTQSDLPRISAALMGSDKINMFFDHLFVKEPGSSYVTSWHNDVPYWPVKGKKIISLWLALDDVTLESGALVFCLGSHKWQFAFQPRTFAHTEDGNTPEQELKAALEGTDYPVETRAFPMKAGDVLAFDAMAIHCAGPNTVKDRMRRGYAIRYTGDDVSYDPRPGVHKMMLEPGLIPGGLIDSQRYPVIYRRTDTSVS